MAPKVMQRPAATALVKGKGKAKAVATALVKGKGRARPRLSPKRS
jgi:hypothetical protein